MVPIPDGLSSLADRYDCFIVDLWGVMHNGVNAFPAAVSCLERLCEQDKRVVILSNAPRRAHAVAARNEELGIASHLCHVVMSSGEAAWQHLSTRSDPWYGALGRRCHHLGPQRDWGMREGLDYDFTEGLEAADFILNTGALSADDTPASYDAFLNEALERTLPMVCANPDLEVIRGERREICAGAVALRYQEMGGQVRYHGKPHRAIYEACFALVGGPARERILAIGDSLRTDIAGANRIGIDGLFITGGLQGDELQVDDQGNADPARLAALCAAAGEIPVAALPVLRW